MSRKAVVRNWCIVLCIGGMDYQSKVYNVTVKAEETSAVVSIAIFDDSIVSAGSVDSVTVSILDDDHVTVEFSMSEYEVSESAGWVTLYISSDTPGAVNYTPCWCTSAMEQLKVSAIRTYVVYVHSTHAWSNVWRTSMWLGSCMPEWLGKLQITPQGHIH